MNRFSVKNNFGWTLVVLIFAALWSATNVESAAPSNVEENVCQRVAVSNGGVSTTTAAQKFDASDDESTKTFDAELSSDAASLFIRFDRSRRETTRRALESERSTRIDQSNRAFSFQTSNPRVVERDGFALLYRSIWACQTVSRPLFLLLLTLRN